VEPQAQRRREDYGNAYRREEKNRIRDQLQQPQRLQDFLTWQIQIQREREHDERERDDVEQE